MGRRWRTTTVTTYVRTYCLQAAVDDDISDEAAGMQRDEFKGKGGDAPESSDKKKGVFGW